MNTTIMPVRGRFLSNKEANESAHNFALQADQFFPATGCLSKELPGLSWPFYHDAYFTLELCLKSYLLAQGVKYDDVRGIRHDLHKALNKAKQLGLRLGVSTLVEKVVMDASQYYEDHEFRYCANGKWELPSPEVLFSFLQVAYRATTGNSPRLPAHVRSSALVTELHAK